MSDCPAAVRKHYRLVNVCANGKIAVMPSLIANSEPFPTSFPYSFQASSSKWLSKVRSDC